MKEILKEIMLPGLTLKHKVIVFYFTLSLCSLSISDESPLWAVALVVVNFINAARLVKKVPLKNEE